MVNRNDALNAKQGMDNLNDQVALSKARQVSLKATATYGKH
jgi:hypothetical protein